MAKSVQVTIWTGVFVSTKCQIAVFTVLSIFPIVMIPQIWRWGKDFLLSLKQLVTAVTVGFLWELSHLHRLTMSVMETPRRCRLIKVSGWHIDEVVAPPLQVPTLSFPVRSLVIGDDVQ